MDSISYKTRFDKKAKVRQVMLEVLKENPEGITSEKYVEKVRQKTRVSRGLIFDLIKELEVTGRIAIERDPKDRRKAIYKPFPQKVIVDIERYRIGQFLSSLREPWCVETSTLYEGYNMTLTALIESSATLEKPLVTFEGVRAQAQNIFHYIEFLVDLIKPFNIHKVAIAVTVEKL